MPPAVLVEFADLDEWSLAAVREAIDREVASSSPGEVHLKAVHCGENGVCLLNQLFSIAPPSSRGYEITKLAMVSRTFRDEKMTVLVEGLIHPCCRVTSLDLNWMHLTAQAMRVLLHLFVDRHCRLKELYLGSAVLDKHQALALAGCELVRNGLEVLEVGELPDQAWIELAASLCASSSRLHSFKGKLPPRFEACQPFFLALPSSKMQWLDFSESVVTAEAAMACPLVGLASVLPQTLIHTLLLNECEFSQLGFRELFRGVAACKSLHMLVLSACNVGEPPVLLEELVQSLPSSHMDCLDLAFLSISNLTSLAAHLQSPSCSLERLNLSGNDLFDDGVCLLAECLQHPNCPLRELRLSYVLASQRGVDSLVRAVRSPNCRLTLLDVNNEGLDNEFDTGALTAALDAAKLARLLCSLISARQVPRTSSRCALRRLPGEMFRLVKQMMALEGRNTITFTRGG
ncbi:hypothetical protein BASA81_002303 [Batrachochytrium salamandrivorans]|nr:hypothetical protein BASA81_002303 [Batrachochytrium salamandrivorans]